MLGFQANLWFFIFLMGSFSFHQTDGQESTIEYNNGRAQQKLCLMRNKGRQRAVSKCFVHYTMKNCSLLRQHMECYIRERKKMCNVDDDELIDKRFRSMLTRKFIGNTTSRCGQLLVDVLARYECRDCSLTNSKANITGDALKLNATWIEVGNDCIEMDINCYPESDFWRSRLTLKDDSNTTSFLSLNFGEPAVARVACRLSPQRLTYDNHSITDMKCESKAIAKHRLDNGCGLCGWNKPQIQRTGDNMDGSFGTAINGCVRLQLNCTPSSTNYTSQLKLNNAVTIDSTHGGNPVMVTVICSDNHDQWMLAGSNDPSQSITEINCVKDADFVGLCGECTMQAPPITITGYHVEQLTNKGCKTILVQCTPNDTNWISSMEVNGTTTNGSLWTRTINSTDLGAPIQFRVFCAGDNTRWIDDQDQIVTNISCKNNSYAGCGRCDKNSLQSRGDPDAQLNITELNLQSDGCKRLRIECIPQSDFTAGLIMNDDPSTNVTSSSGVTANLTLVCRYVNHSTHWGIENSTRYTLEVHKISCTTKYANSTPLSSGCGGCQTRQQWLNIQNITEKAPTNKGCKEVTLRCIKDPTSPTPPRLIINEEIRFDSNSHEVSVDLTCTSKAPDRISGRSSWVVKKQQNETIVESIRCQRSTGIPPNPCQTCSRKQPFINLTGLEILGDYTLSNSCLDLKLNCWRDTGFESRLQFDSGYSIQTTANMDMVQDHAQCNDQGDAWVNGNGNKILAVYCNPRFERN